MISAHVISPDRLSGEAFRKKLVENGINAQEKIYKIPPRVIYDKISDSPEIKIALDNIFKELCCEDSNVVIACNTLQLWLPQIDDKYKKKFKIYTTFDACEWKFKKLSKKPLWLGTTPLVENTKKFPTLLSFNANGEQELVQEIIWRIKMYGDDDISRAPERIKMDIYNKNYQKIKLQKLVAEVIEYLWEIGVDKAILGCTELPVFFPEYERGIEFINPAEILAEYIKYKCV